MSEHNLKSRPPKDNRDELTDLILAAELKLLAGEQLAPMDERVLAYTVFAAGCASCRH
ncbi:hypothetical protein ABZ639_00970 [Saccharomonospora sp. NPDC006951]